MFSPLPCKIGWDSGASLSPLRCGAGRHQSVFHQRPQIPQTVLQTACEGHRQYTWRAVPSFPLLSHRTTTVAAIEANGDLLIRQTIAVTAVAAHNVVISSQIEAVAVVKANGAFLPRQTIAGAVVEAYNIVLSF